MQKNYRMQTITIAKGDGIGPEIMESTLQILKAAGAPLQFEEIEIGEKVYHAGYSSGISNEAWDNIRKNKIILKGPITTPQGGGYKSLNVSLRKTLGLFANIRPCRSYFPFIKTKHPKLDLLIIRENEEDLYGGIEHQQTDEVVQCLKLISRPGCEKISRYAFEITRQQGRKSIACFTKDNIMKLTDGLFHKVFDEVGSGYRDIAQEHLIVDIGAARLAETPERFDVILLPNLYGDILSDVAAQISGSVGLAGSANIGHDYAMFEAIHGSAPDIAGQSIANPSGLIHASVMMLHHLGHLEIGDMITNAWLKTIEDGIHTPDVFTSGVSMVRASTEEFTKAVIQRLGEKPTHLKPVSTKGGQGQISVPKHTPAPPKSKQLVGVDIFLHCRPADINKLAENLQSCATANLQLELITNRGTKVWPNGFEDTFCTDHWRCRFMGKKEGALPQFSDLLQLQAAINEAALPIIKTENLYTFDGQIGFSLGQGQ